MRVTLYAPEPFQGETFSLKDHKGDTIAEYRSKHIGDHSDGKPVFIWVLVEDDDT